MPENVLVGADVFRFGAMELHGNLAKLDDVREFDVAIHRPLKRDGAKVERMGRKPHAFTASLFFVGRAWRADLLRFQAMVENEPTQVLVHPVYGRLRMFCQKVAVGVEPAAGTNVATATVQFIENNVDTKLTAKTSDGVAARSQAVTAAIDETDVQFALFPSAVSVGTALTAAAESFRAATVTAFEAGSPDASLTTRLDAVANSIASAIVALRADSLAEDDTTIYPAIQSAERLYDACQLLRDAFLAERPPLVEYVVPAPLSVFLLAGQFYGSDGLDRVDEILANNPQILNPAAIPAGTVVKMATATV